MSDIERARAHLRVLELEEALIAAKADGTLTDALKDDLRHARRAYRELSSGTANPDVITAKVEG